MKRPNFIFIMTDQHRSDWLGCYGHPVVKTPNIDGLAKQGTKFTDFHAASPVCMPNRASFMTSKYPTTHGLRYNGCLLPKRANTFVDVLKQGGYKTASIGKSHLQPFTSTPPRDQADFNSGPIADSWQNDDLYYGNEEPERYDTDGKYDFPTPYYGFDYVDMVSGHGDTAGGHYRQWFRKKHSNWQQLTDPKSELPHNYTCPQAFRTPIPEDSYPTAYIRDRATQYLHDNKNSTQPMFTFISFPDPHHPFNPPGKYWDMYNPDDFTISPAFSDHKNPPPPLQNAKNDFDRGYKDPQRTTVFMDTEQHIKQAMALTAGMITIIDDAVGDIIQTLKDTGQFDNTVIIFNADHGDYLGDFNLMLKGAWAKESISKVPFIWHDPMNKTMGQVTGLTSTIDLAPTILERAGIKPYFGMQGISLIYSMQTNTDIRKSLLVEYNDGMKRMGFDAPARVRTVISTDWHYTFYKNQDWGELYNRQTDPNHLHNVWNDPKYTAVLLQQMADLNTHLTNLMDESPRSNRLA